jgi:hypothetical protein
MKIAILILLTIVFSTLSQSTPFLEQRLTMGGGIHDYLIKFDRAKLESVSLALEKYHRKAQSVDTPIGGLHDYIWVIGDEDLRAYIFREVNEHPELNNIVVINDLAKEFENGNNDGFEVDTSIKQFLSGLDRDKLAKLALTMERYHRVQIGKEKLIGGLHDYIGNMSKEDLHKYIMNEIKCHKELNKEVAFKALLQEDENNAKPSPVFLEISKVDSLENAIKAATREKLELVLIKLNDQLKRKYKYLVANLGPFTNDELRKFIYKIIEDNNDINLDDLLNNI